MGGAESFEDENGNPPSVMLNSRAAIVSGELFPWLPSVGNFEGSMSPRTRMARRLLAILRACTRNRAVWSAAGLLRVLLRSAERIFSQDIESTDLGIVVSCSVSSDILVHSRRRGRLLGRIIGVQAHTLCLSSDGITVAWNEHLCTLSTYTINGTLAASKQLPLASSVSCIKVSSDGHNALVGLNQSTDSERGYDQLDEENRLILPFPSICFFDLYTMKAFHSIKLALGQDITTFALNEDSSNLLVSTADKQLILYRSFIQLSLKVVDQMLKLGWEGDGLSPLMK